MNKKILLVDDNPHILEAIELILSTESYEVFTLTKVDTIVEDVTKIKPAVILLDLLLSGKNGKEVAKELKKTETTANIPIVIISAHPSAQKAALQVGADAFLAKPFDIVDLLALVEKYSAPKNNITA